MSLVELAGESVGYRDLTVLSDVSLRIDAGERIALVGESGVGKTTLLRLLYERCAARAALVPQDLGLVQALPVFHNVFMGRLHCHGALRNLKTLLWPARGDVAAVGEVVEILRLSDKLFAPAGSLSGGQQQRTAIGRALFHPGDMLIADEPVSAVDEHQAREILDAIAERKKTVILALHDRALALSFASRIIGLRGGRVALDEASAGMTPADLDPLYRT